ncbi:MAG: type II toxin-antitoxin system VapC family toxin [archaeon GB-1845-036]|nr:type II toxin-antitoxin system VapC family toxin [Candidatus Culexmicrobium thermophilum]
MYFFDAASIVNLIKRGVVKPFANGATLNLALYESINAIWKEYQLLKRLEKNTALLFLDVISSIFNVINLISIRGVEREVFNLASKENLTVYDASYLYIAMKNKFTLITDDRRLGDKASKYIKVITSSELASKYEV